MPYYPVTSTSSSFSINKTTKMGHQNQTQIQEVDHKNLQKTRSSTTTSRPQLLVTSSSSQIQSQTQEVGHKNLQKNSTSSNTTNSTTSRPQHLDKSSAIGSRDEADHIGDLLNVKEEIAKIDTHIEIVTNILVDSLEDQGKKLELKPGETGISKDDWEKIKVKINGEVDYLRGRRTELTSLKQAWGDKKNQFEEIRLDSRQSKSKEYQEYKRGLERMSTLKIDFQKKKSHLRPIVDNLEIELVKIKLKNQKLEIDKNLGLVKKIQNVEEKILKKDQIVDICNRVLTIVNHAPALKFKPNCSVDDDRVFV